MIVFACGLWDTLVNDIAPGRYRQEGFCRLVDALHDSGGQAGDGNIIDHRLLEGSHFALSHRCRNHWAAVVLHWLGVDRRAASVFCEGLRGPVGP